MLMQPGPLEKAIAAAKAQQREAARAMRATSSAVKACGAVTAMTDAR